jgi:hypothetical protein
MKENMINCFSFVTNTAFSIAFPPTFDKALTHLQLVIENLPQKEFDFHRDPAFPDDQLFGSEIPFFSRAQVTESMQSSFKEICCSKLCKQPHSSNSPTERALLKSTYHSWSTQQSATEQKGSLTKSTKTLVYFCSMFMI